MANLEVKIEDEIPDLMEQLDKLEHITIKVIKLVLGSAVKKGVPKPVLLKIVAERLLFRLTGDGPCEIMTHNADPSNGALSNSELSIRWTYTYMNSHGKDVSHTRTLASILRGLSEIDEDGLLEIVRHLRVE